MESDIKNFFNYFRQHLSYLYALTLPEEYPFVTVNNIRTLLACTYIEALAKGYYRSKNMYLEDQEAGVRFRKFIEEFSCLNNIYARISLGRLVERLETDSKYSEIIKHIYENYPHLSEVLDGSIAREDPDVDEFRERLKENSFTKQFPELISQFHEFTYYSILWNDYRSGLVHEARVRKAGPDIGLDEPYYISMGELDGKVTIKFVIPWEFILKTFQNCLGGFEHYCRSQRINPYTLYDFR